jgi:hypothetical protein
MTELPLITPAIEVDSSFISHDSLAERLERLESQQAAIILALENLTNGMSATYQGVASINQMLSAVQQMALNMPGLKGKLMRGMAGNLNLGENTNG